MVVGGTERVKNFPRAHFDSLAWIMLSAESMLRLLEMILSVSKTNADNEDLRQDRHGKNNHT